MRRCGAKTEMIPSHEQSFFAKTRVEVKVMDKLNDPEMLKYFKTLPAYVQESIKQSSMTIDSLEQLEKVAENLTRRK